MPRKVPPGYAGDTSVSVERSKADIEALLRKHGAEGYHSGWQAASNVAPGWDSIEFLWQGKVIRFKLTRPALNDATLQKTLQTVRDKGAYLEQLSRQRWRLLLLVVKAKLEAVEGGVVVFEEEFLPFIVDPVSGKTVGEILLPRLAAGTGLQLEAGRG